jgi:hypothetical protein
LVSAPTLSSGMAAFSNGSSINANPQFVNQATHDLHLSATSPAVDAGSSSIAWTGGTGVSLVFDADGNARIKGAAIDIGAYEF